MKALVVGITILSVLTACKESEERNTNVLKLALGSEPPNLDPQLADTGVSVFLLKQVLSTLFDYDSQHKIILYDAKSFEWNEKAFTLKIVLRDDLKWSDGVPLDACHYRDGILRALDPKVPSTLSEILFDIKFAREFKAGKLSAEQVGIRCDDKVLTIESLKARSSKLMHALAFIVSAPVRFDRIKLLGSKWVSGDGNSAGIGSGAFVIREWSHDRRVVLAARRLSEKSLPVDRFAKVDEVQMPILRDPRSALAMYQSNDLDYIEEIPPIFLGQLKDLDDAMPAESFTTYMIGFSLAANPVLKDKRVRQALALCANQFEVPQLLKGGESEAKGWVPPGLLPEAARPQSSLFDPIKAAALLDAAGFKDRSKFPKLKLYFNSGERHQLLMERFANNVKTYLGIKLELEVQDWKVLVAKLKSSAPDLYRYAWTAVYPDPVFFLELFLSDSFNNFGKWKNAEYDILVKSLVGRSTEVRDKKFWSDLRRAQDILVSEDPAIIPIYHYVRNALVKPYVKGLVQSGMGTGYLKNVSKE